MRTRTIEQRLDSIQLAISQLQQDLEDFAKNAEQPNFIALVRKGDFDKKTDQIVNDFLKCKKRLTILSLRRLSRLNKIKLTQLQRNLETLHDTYDEKIEQTIAENIAFVKAVASIDSTESSKSSSSEEKIKQHIQEDPSLFSKDEPPIKHIYSTDNYNPFFQADLEATFEFNSKSLLAEAEDFLNFDEEMLRTQYQF